MKNEKMTIYSVTYSEIGCDCPLVKWFRTMSEAKAFYDLKDYVDYPVKHNFTKTRAQC